MTITELTRRSFFGWLGALAALPFVGSAKKEAESRWQHVAFTYDGVHYGTAWGRCLSPEEVKALAAPETIAVDHPLATGLVAYSDGRFTWNWIPHLQRWGLVCDR